MAVCALTMLDGVEDEVTAAGGVLLLVLALVFAWLSTHVADRGDHILGTILTVGAHASLIGLGGHESYSGGSPSADTPEQQTPPPSQENKPDDGEPGTERGEGEGAGEGAEGVRTDLLLDIQSKPPQAGRLHTSDDEEEEEEEDDDDEEELEEEDKKIMKHIPVLSSIISPTTNTATSISVRLKYLNDTEEVAVVEPQDTVGVLKSKYFSGREHQIKLIYQGHLLQDPKKTLLSLNITHNSVIHCHISQVLREATPEEETQSGAGTGTGSGVSGGFRAAGVAISTSSLVVPVFVVILAVVWYFRINYRQFFTAPATISLVGVTVFFSFLIFGMHSR
ncbi:transmembrane and ubiquitin-like domain-containing protein 2 [Anoplopoma fimbria]|uniref:transmembrane and ubiquitin-like domain-containing protein 2 n=1 Tax=Anoplopoma fimbria TaxID=229290 RepID=UPI0023EDEC58|nr:transmembrane and ubiquitin-like domain-containing protein 2 [Anoplopoma fimbria]XP_054463841.1 transmembrane and ubiquitin-like domain-containing protein 2 [Anoplopoma fimbria]